jgi:UDP-N-acetyl-D-mannosaminuronic acid dehydrogenase
MTNEAPNFLQIIRDRQFTMAVIGIGRVGLPLALSFADRGVNVVGVDRNPDHVEAVNEGLLPFLEHGAEPLLKETLDLGTFKATTSADSAVRSAEVVVLTVGTPLDTNLRADTSSNPAHL